MSEGGALVVCETRDGAVTTLTLELLGLAQALGGVAALLMTDNATAAADLIAHGADRVFICPADGEEYEGEVWVREAVSLADELHPMVVLAGHTAAGADLAPRLAFRLKSGIATGCVALAAESDRIVATRPCYGGNAHETLSLLREMRSSFGTTIVMVTHDPRAEAYVDEVHTLDKGVLLTGPKPDLAAARA